jgi:hypothetical protein
LLVFNTGALAGLDLLLTNRKRQGARTTDEKLNEELALPLATSSEVK